MPKVGTLLILIVLLAAFLRLFLLDTIPPGLYPDEAMNGLDALKALDRADFRVFYPDNNGREGLFINLQAISVQLFGVSAWSLRVVSALAGTLTIFALYFLGRELGRRWFKDPRKQEAYGLCTAFLLAVSFWHINFSRIGFRAILLPLLSTLAFFFLLKAIRTRALSAFLLSGFTFGLSLSTYIASRILPVLVAPFFLHDARVGIRNRSWIFGWLGFLTALTLAILPLAGYFFTHPEDFVGRAGAVSVFAADQPVRELLLSAGKTFGMFHLVGDGNWRHNVSGAPLLDVFTGIFFLLGIIAAAGWIIRRRPHWRLAGFLLAWFFAMLLPAVTTVEGLPHALRSLGVLPPTMLLAAVGALWLWEFTVSRFSLRKRVSIVSVLAITILIINFHQYFNVWAGNPNVPGAFRTDLTAAAEYLNANSGKTQYVIVNEGGTLVDGIPMPVATVRFLTSDASDIHYLTPQRVNEIVPDFDNTLILVTAEPSEELETTLRAAFPTLERMEEQLFTAYRL